jgi:prepilin-type N-terminal cleavage/methylation domain-containing protein
MKTHLRSEGGYSLVEMMFVTALIGVAAGMAVMVMPRQVTQARADGSLSAAVNMLRLARNRAIGERRNIEVRFLGTNKVQLARVEVPSGTTTILSDTYLENNAQFTRFSTLGDTPDAFGGSGAIAFGTSPTRFFSSEGTFIDASGDPLNGTVFIGVPGQPETARAVTIFGATAFIRIWRHDGQKWVEQ